MERKARHSDRDEMDRPDPASVAAEVDRVAERNRQRVRAGNRTPLSTHGAGAPSMLTASANTDQVHDEDERLVGSDRPAGPALAVSEHRRDRDPPATADPHPGHTLIPPGDHLALTQTKLEGAAT